MGNDGGCKITTIKSLKDDWKSFQKRLYKYLEQEYMNSEKDSYEEREFETLCNLVDKYPKDINKLNSSEIIDLFRPFEFCDCPKLFQDCIVTGQGSYVLRPMDILSECLSGIYIETWT